LGEKTGGLSLSEGKGKVAIGQAEKGTFDAARTLRESRQILEDGMGGLTDAFNHGSHRKKETWKGRVLRSYRRKQNNWMRF